MYVSECTSMHRHGGFKGLYMFLIVILCTGMGVLRDCGLLRVDFCAQAWGFYEIV